GDNIGPKGPTGIKEAYKMATGEKEKNMVTKDSLIGDVINRSPEAKRVVEKYFGNGCFTCPGIKVETLAFGAMMHNVDPASLVKEINEINWEGAEGKNGG
nr:DUF1858 domain-containing protein [Nitrospiraceae bacterium]